MRVKINEKYNAESAENAEDAEELLNGENVSFNFLRR